MRVIRHTDSGFTNRVQELIGSSSLFDPGIEERTRAIIAEVRGRGDEALLELTERFDGAKLSVEQLSVTQAEVMAASVRADETLRAAVEEAERNIAAFAKKSRRGSRDRDLEATVAAFDSVFGSKRTRSGVAEKAATVSVN